jgi:CO/xanthine dehydrogenase Mo-binding subunit
MRGATSTQSPHVLGTDVRRREAIPKLTGAARYVDDLPRDGVWVGGTLRSESPRGRILGIDLDPGFEWERVVVVRPEDIPGDNVVSLLIDDQPALAEGEFRHADEPLALVAAPDRETLARALAAMTVRSEPLEPLFDLDDSLAGKVLLHRDDNVFKRIEILRADVEPALAAAEVVVEGEYHFGAQEHVYIEPQGMQAEWRDGEVVLHGSMQCPYYVQKGISRCLGVRSEQIRVVQTVTGGGFGGKEEYPSMIAAHAALLARKAGRPVRIVYDRSEDMRATTKRHPGRVRIRTGFDRQGRMLAADIDFVLDGGAYCTLSPVVLSRGAIHAAGPYECPAVRIVARAVATTMPPFGAFRGFGAPQSLFAFETHLDRAAAELGLDPVEVRRRNLVREGGILATGQCVGSDAHAELALDEALDSSRFCERREEFERFNRDSASRAGAGRHLRRGIGLALFHHGSGFTGSGEVMLASEVCLRAARGEVEVLTSQTEIGQGTRTILAQAAAEGLGAPVERVVTSDPDTSVVPDSGPTVASRTGMVVGGLLVEAGRALRAKLEAASGRVLDSPEAVAAALDEVAAADPIEVRTRYRKPKDMEWDDAAYRGDAYADYAWACYVAALEVDLRTGVVRVLDFHAVQEVGRVMNPHLAFGQIEGGVAQGLGWALHENVVWRDGRMANPTMTDYIVPTTMDTPPIIVRLLERGNPRAVHGAKGIGELPMDGPAPAVANALRQALGVEFTTIPAIPERVLAQIEGVEAEGCA